MNQKKFSSKQVGVVLLCRFNIVVTAMVAEIEIQDAYCYNKKVKSGK